MVKVINPKRSEIWLVEFDPQVASEIKKTRPAIVLSISDVESIPTRYVVPIRHFEEKFRNIYYFYGICANSCAVYYRLHTFQYSNAYRSF